MRSKFLLTLAFSSLGLAACSPSYEHYDDPTQSYVNPNINNSVDTIIASEAATAVAAAQTMARIERTKTPPTVVDPNANAPADLKQKITEMNWSGPADALLKDIAEKVGYTYIPLAHPAPSEIDVSISIVNRTVAEALDDISLQIQDRASINVDVGNRTMSMRLKGPNAPSEEAEAKTPKPPGHAKPHGRRHVYHPARNAS